MARREGDGSEMGSDEQLAPDPEEDERRERFQSAARQGADQLAAVVDQSLQTLAEDFSERSQATMERLLEEVGGGSPDKPEKFVRGALFGALVLAVGVLLGRSGGRRT